MRDDTPSRTALATAYLRAAHQVLDGAPLLFPDPVALPLLGPRAHADVAATPERYQSPFGRGLRSHVCLRARFAEDKLAEAPGARWYVLVGAGFDTFALRQPEWARHLRIVEIDHPATLHAKHAMMAAAGLAAPENVSCVPADLTRQSLGDVLARLEIPADDEVFFSWLGVSMYLDPAAVEAALAAMAGAARRSSVCLSFKQPINQAIERDVQMARFVASLGEPFLSLYTPEEMAALLFRHGFPRQQFLTHDVAREMYFTPPRHGIPAPHNTTIVWASRG